MENLFILLLLASMGGIGYGVFQGISNKVRKKKLIKKDAKKIILASTATFVISFIGVGLTATPIEDTPQSSKTEIVATETKDDSAEKEKEKQEKLKKEKLEKKKYQERAT